MTDVYTEKLPRISAYLVIGGRQDFDPDQCTRAVGIAPTQVWRQKYEHLLNRHDLNAVEWMVGVEKKPLDDTDDALREVLIEVWPARDSIKNFVRANGLRAWFACSVTISDERPVYRVSPETLQKLAYFGFELSLDIFDYSD